MAVLGGILYGLLTQAIALLLGLSSELAIFAASVVFLFYLASRFLLLFSGVNTLYYSKAKKTGWTELYEDTSFYKTAQWVGKFYHAHDMVLLVFLILICLSFLISLTMDLIGNRSFGDTIRSLFDRGAVSPRSCYYPVFYRFF
jgi:hypothetical protein